jgi:hypothetical protein
MRAAEVVVGQVYLANVSGRVVSVRIERPVLVGFRQRRTAWEATNLTTGRRILIRSAQRLRFQSLIGRLRTGPVPGRRQRVPVVSIPHR